MNTKRPQRWESTEEWPCESREGMQRDARTGCIQNNGCVMGEKWHKLEISSGKTNLLTL